MNNRYGEGSRIFSADLEIKIVNNMKELCEYTDVWNKLLRQINNSNPFLELDWIEKWWNYLGEGHRMFVLLIMENDAVVGICPLMMTKKMTFHEINFIGFPHASYMDFIVDNNRRGKIIISIINYLLSFRGNHVVYLHGIYEESPNYKILTNYMKECKSSFAIRRSSAFIIKINKSFQEYFIQRSKHHSIKLLEKKEKKLAEAGTIVCEKLEYSKIDDIFRLHNKRWKTKSDSSNFARGKVGEFFRQLAIAENKSFKVDVTVLMLKENMLAFYYGFICNEKYFAYRVAHDDDFSLFAPGGIILKRVINECFDKGMDIFDFGIGNERYKQEWSDDKVYVSKVIFPAETMLSKIVFIKYSIREKLYDTLRKSPKIVNFKVNTLGKISSYLSSIYFKECINKVISKVKNKGHLRSLLSKPIGFIYSVEKDSIYEKDLSRDQLYNKGNKFTTNPEEYRSNPHDNKIGCNSADCIIFEAKLGDLDSLHRLMKVEKSKIVNRFYSKQRCFVIAHCGKVVHCSWLNTKGGEILDNEYKLSIEKSKACICQYDTDENYKNQGLEIYAINYINDFLYRNGFVKSSALIKGEKSIYENYVIQCGYKPVYYKKIRKLFSIPITTQSLEINGSI